MPAGSAPLDCASVSNFNMKHHVTQLVTVLVVSKHKWTHAALGIIATSALRESQHHNHERETRARTE